MTDPTIMIKKETIIKLNQKNQRLQEINKKLSSKIKEQKEVAIINHDREDFLKCELLKLNPNFKFDNSSKFIKKMKIRKRDNNLCCFCKRNIYDVSQDSTLHHKIPKRYGGLDSPNNLITICYECHNLLEELIKHVENAILKSKPKSL